MPSSETEDWRDAEKAGEAEADVPALGDALPLALGLLPMLPLSNALEKARADSAPLRVELLSREALRGALREAAAVAEGGALALSGAVSRLVEETEPLSVAKGGDAEEVTGPLGVAWELAEGTLVGVGLAVPENEAPEESVLVPLPDPLWGAVCE